jgi:Protein of unknown function (DUF1425)
MSLKIATPSFLSVTEIEPFPTVMNTQSACVTLVLLTLLTGCARTGEKIGGVSRAISTGQAGGAYPARNGGKYDYENREQFVTMNFRAQRSVTASGLMTRPLEDGRLEVAGNLRNRLNRRIEIQVQCIFKDLAGFSTGDETPWQTLILTENGQETVKFASMNDKARNFTIRAREAR